MTKVKRVIRWSNDRVMAFDEKGDQIVELQGPYDAKRDAVLAAADDETVFEHGAWREGTIAWPRRIW